VAVVALVLLDHVQADPADGAGCAVVGEGVVQVGAGDRATDVGAGPPIGGEGDLGVGGVHVVDVALRRKPHGPGATSGYSSVSSELVSTDRWMGWGRRLNPAG
jgi:hypothetical protein